MQPQPAAQQRKYALLMLVVTLLAIFILVLLAEGGIRVRQWLRHGQTGTVNSLLQEDPASGLTVPRPGSHHGGRIQINRLGFRGPELGAGKPDLRIAFLGASTTFCAEVSSNEATWPHLVAERIRAAYPSLSVDYVNAGVPGYVLETIRTNWHARVRSLRPDIVVIYEATNELSKDTRALAKARGLIHATPEAQQSWLARHSMLWFLVEKNLAIRSAQQRAVSDTPRLTELPPDLTKGFQQRLASWVREIQAEGKLVVLPTFAYRVRHDQTSDEQLKAAESALYYMPYMSIPALLAGYEAYNRAIRTVARDTGALLVEGELDIPGDARHFTDSVHFTDLGSAAMAKRVATALLDSAALRRRLSTNVQP
jgi:lysophospholipase L1-like esterase